MLIHCDRCHKKVEGDIWEEGSAGVYVVAYGYWMMFALPFESVICDCCMWKDPRYIVRYGKLASPDCDEYTV